MQKFSQQANSATRKNLFLSGAEGIGLGFLGIGLPDIPLFVGVILKSIYEVALHFGYSYESVEERYFVLQVIQSALSYGNELVTNNQSVNEFLSNGQLPKSYTESQQIESTASTLSKELLYSKFLQGIPIIGVAGGVFDIVYLKKILKYAKLKYAQRFLLDRKGRSCADTTDLH